MMLKKRLFVAGFLTLLLAASQLTLAQLNNQVPLPGNTIPKFVEPMPHFAFSRVDASGGALTVSAREIQQQILPAANPSLGVTGYPTTTCWGYEINNGTTLFPAHYPGFTVEAIRNVPVTATFLNKLGNQTLYTPQGANAPGIIPIDRTINWADPLNQGKQFTTYNGPVPIVAHLHGGEVSSKYDGGPSAWITPDNDPNYPTQIFGPAFAQGASNVCIYPNQQEASTLWFHDHALGATRLNVYAGLATFYWLRDEWDTGLPGNPAGLPWGDKELELAIQDKMFDTNGNLYFPNQGQNPTVHPFWLPEFFGDVMLVNGKAWPYLKVEPRRYRFRLLDGCNARFLELYMQPNLPIWQIGSEGGLLDHPVMIDRVSLSAQLKKLLIAPGERGDIIIDFTGQQGKTFTLMNSAKAPYPSGAAPDPWTTAQIMQFRVELPLSAPDSTINPATNPSLRPSPVVKLVNFATCAPATGMTVDVTRELTLKEVAGPWGPLQVTVNNEMMMAPTTETPQEGNTEIWKIVNLTMDAHPMHLHLVQFQLLSRQKFNKGSYLSLWNSLFPGGMNMWDGKYYKPGQYMPAFGPPKPYNYYAPLLGGNPDVTPYLTGAPIPALPNEQGWKDTYKAYPGEVTTFLVRFAPQAKPVASPKSDLYFPFDPAQGDGFVWHCHIVDHEDNEMMRPYTVGTNPLAPLRKDAAPGNPNASGTPSSFNLAAVYPNPFNPSSVIRFDIPKDARVTLKVFNAMGEQVQTLVDQQYSAGSHSVNWNAAGLPSGTYFYRIQAGEFTDMKKATILK